jgi:hypothetical protein
VVVRAGAGASGVGPLTSIARAAFGTSTAQPSAAARPIALPTTMANFIAPKPFGTFACRRSKPARGAYSISFGSVQYEL